MAKETKTPTFEEYLESKVVESYNSKGYGEVQDEKERKKEYEKLYPKQETKDVKEEAKKASKD